MRWIIYFSLGVVAHIDYWKLPVDLQWWRFWTDVLLWPFIMLWDWPKLASALPLALQNGIGHLIGLILLFAIIAAFGRGMAKRGRGER
jgi:hypothetical protein